MAMRFITQAEYESQDRPARRTPIGTVVVERFHTWKRTQVFAGREIEQRFYQVETCGEMFEYCTNPKYDTGTLYTMDGDGNYKSPSVFREPFCT